MPNFVLERENFPQRDWDENPLAYHLEWVVPLRIITNLG